WSRTSVRTHPRARPRSARHVDRANPVYLTEAEVNPDRAAAGSASGDVPEARSQALNQRRRDSCARWRRRGRYHDLQRVRHPGGERLWALEVCEAETWSAWRGEGTVPSFET